MRRFLAPFLTAMITIALSGCLGGSDDDGPAAATDTTPDEPAADPASAIDFTPSDPTPDTTPAPTAAPDDDGGVELLTKDCLAKAGLLGIRISVC